MTIFCDFETPAAKKPVPPAKQLVALLIKPTLLALLDPPTQTVAVRAEAKTAFSDGTAGDGIPVTFFLNGTRICDVSTDEFGVAYLEQTVPANIFTMGDSKGELIARVRGFAKEATAAVVVKSKRIELGVEYSWRQIEHSAEGGLYYPRNQRCDGLVFKVCVEMRYPNGLAIEGIVVLVERLNPSVGPIETLAIGKLDSAGNCTIEMPNYCWDRWLAEGKKYPAELSGAELRIRLHDWPEKGAPFVVLRF